MDTSKKKILRKICMVLFFIYVIVLAYFVFFSDGYGRTVIHDEYRYNLHLFSEIKRFYVYSTNVGIVASVTNLAGNIVAFMPFGALIRWVRNKKTSLLCATVHTLLFSLTIEFVQLVTKVGVFDVDDLVLNTIGGILGYACYFILATINRRWQNVQ